MKYPVLVALALAPLGCAGAEPSAAAPLPPPVVVDLTPPPVASAASKPAPKPEPKKETPDPQAATREAAEFGIIGVLNTGDPNAPPADTAKGNMWGDSIGDSFGAGGLGLSGVGVGGGRGEGIGLGSIGTLGHGSSGQGYGSGHGSLRRHPATIRTGATTVNGRLPPEVIQRLVRANFGRFRLCYEQGLKAKPKLAGTIVTKFTIERDGSISNLGRDATTNMPDDTVVGCVVGAFTALSFPQPEGGTVSVVYPLTFGPPEDPPATPTAPAPAPAAPPAAAPKPATAAPAPKP